MKKLNNKLGMTMAEMLIVVAIIAVLGGVAFIAVNNHQRSLGQLERDGIAKEIFVAAQNHLTAAYGEGYLGVSNFGTAGTYVNPTDSSKSDSEDSVQKVYYYVVNMGAVSAGGSAMFDLMLPFGSIDETVRAGGSYLIRYQPKTATVLDVFYCSNESTRFGYNMNNAVYTSSIGGNGLIPNYNNDGAREKRKNYSDGSVLGWYGGSGVELLPTTTLQNPTIEVINAERLYVKITDPNYSIRGAALRLLITGETSKKSHYIDVYTSSTGPNAAISSYEIELDNISTDAGSIHFSDLVFSDGGGNDFIPGENITVQAVAYSTSILANIAYSGKVTTNSLFADETTTTTAFINNIRHLENLDKNVSNLGANDSVTIPLITITRAEQITSLNWSADDAGYWRSKTVAPATGKSLSTGYSSSPSYYPISPDYSLTYDGKKNSISSIIAVDTNSGLFGSSSSVTRIENLELIDFNITGTTSAGALAGTLNGCTVSNVLARNSTNASGVNIFATGNAGGLIGNQIGGGAEYCAASVIVGGKMVGDTFKVPTTAGGLIGTASGSVTRCYSGGHTKNGSYVDWVERYGFDVTGTTAGGLIGSSSTSVNSSYSTCSVCGFSMAGGFIGKVSGGSVINCYATGLIDQGQKDAAKNAFIANGTPIDVDSFKGNYYYSIINEITTDGKAAGELMNPFPTEGEHDITEYFPHTKPLDWNADTYNDFVSDFTQWDSARVYDSSLVQYYSGKFPLRTVLQLPVPENGGKTKSDNTYFVSTHYGDWPAPEIFIINN